jgi:signal transduction histidine kinase
LNGTHEVLEIVRDVTERKRLEKEILEISGNERRSIGQDLHDGLGQLLTGVAFMSKGLEEKLTAKTLPEAVTAAKIATLTNQAISQTRNLAHGLCPIQLTVGGLMPALQELASTTETTFNVSCSVECSKPILLQDNDTETNLYRIAQEAVNNAIKHGKAKKIAIQLSKGPERTVMIIKNDGLNFPKVLPEKRGIGLDILRYRAGMIHGTLEIKSESKGGVSVICSFPNYQGGSRLKSIRDKKSKDLISAYKL